MNYAKVGFWLGLILAVVQLLLTIFLVDMVMDIKKDRMTHSSTLTGYPTERLDEMLRYVKSIENFVRTTPLVECGDYPKR